MFRMVLCGLFGRVPKCSEFVILIVLRCSDGNRLVCKAQIFSAAPGLVTRPALQACPILCRGVCVSNWHRYRRRPHFLTRQLVDPFGNLCCESVFVHPVHERCKVRRGALRKRLHCFKHNAEFFFVEFSIQVQTQQVIHKCDLWRHLKLLRQIICSREIVARYCVVQ